MREEQSRGSSRRLSCCSGAKKATTLCGAVNFSPAQASEVCAPFVTPPSDSGGAAKRLAATTAAATRVKFEFAFFFTRLRRRCLWRRSLRSARSRQAVRRQSVAAQVSDANSCFSITARARFDACDALPCGAAAADARTNKQTNFELRTSNLELDGGICSTLPFRGVVWLDTATRVGGVRLARTRPPKRCAIN